MNRKFLSCALGMAALLGTTAAFAGDYSGTYTGNGLSVTLVANANGYTGQIQKGNATYPLSAHEQAGELAGNFIANRQPYAFVATAGNGQLSFATGGTTYDLHRNAPAQVHPEALSGYSVIKQNDAGIALGRSISNVRNTVGALQTVFPDLANYFGVRPTITGRCGDTRDRSTELVSFTAPAGDQRVKGLVTVRLRTDGARVYVVFADPQATPAQWSDLMNAQTGGPASDDPAVFQLRMDAVHLTPYPFADGTGSIGLADGWNSQSQSESNCYLVGPNNQFIRMATSAAMYPPTGFAIQGNKPIGQFSPDPGTELANMITANNRILQAQGQTYYVFEKVLLVRPVPSPKPNTLRAQITYDLTQVDPQTGQHPMRGMINFEYGRPFNGISQCYIYMNLVAPRDTFAEDLPTMMAQAMSLGENPDAIRAKAAGELAAQKKLADAQHAAADTVAQARYKLIAGEEDNSLKTMRMEADSDEVIRGIRKIEDTQTGETTMVDLGDVHAITDALNEQDPGRYKEIPLRDDMYPSAAHVNDPDYLQR